MSFQIQLMRYTGENNRIVKSPYITDIWACNGNLRNESSILKPTIIIEKATEPMNTDYNYMYIDKFKRYYFITDIISKVNSIWEIHGKVDVLYTYGTEILNSRCIIDKVEDKTLSNVYLNDGSFVMDSHKFNQVKQFPNGLSEQGYNILICAGGA